MSGGHFNYKQYEMNDMAGDIKRHVDNNSYELSKETLDKFREGIKALEISKRVRSAHRLANFWR